VHILRASVQSPPDLASRQHGVTSSATPKIAEGMRNKRKLEKKKKKKKRTKEDEHGFFEEGRGPEV